MSIDWRTVISGALIVGGILFNVKQRLDALEAEIDQTKGSTDESLKKSQRDRLDALRKDIQALTR
jgi:hypothetical protein